MPWWSAPSFINKIGSKIMSFKPVADFVSKSSDQLTPILSNIGKSAIDLINSETSRLLESGFGAEKGKLMSAGLQAIVGNLKDYYFRGGNEIDGDKKDMSGVLMNGSERAAVNTVKRLNKTGRGMNKLGRKKLKIGVYRGGGSGEVENTMMEEQDQQQSFPTRAFEQE